MKCRNCGRLLLEGTESCPGCGMPVYPYAPTIQSRRKTKPDTALIVAVVVIEVIVAIGIASVADRYYAPRLQPDLALYFSYEGSLSGGLVSVDGIIYNYGHSACFAVVDVTIQDRRGWSISDTIYTERVEANGGHVHVHEYYDWPDFYNGQFFQDHPGEVVPELYYDISAWR
jgi:hypothetical protein